MKDMVKQLVGTHGALRNSRNMVMDIVSSVSADGSTVNTVTHNKAERRDISVITPYGVSSSALDDMLVQIISNDINNQASMVGVNDKNKPNVSPGETILYSNFGCTISLLVDGNISVKSRNNIILTSGSGKSVTSDEIYDHIHDNSIHYRYY